MPYAVKKGKPGQKPFVIVNQKTGAVVGQSDDLDKANASIGYRMAAEAKKEKANAHTFAPKR